MAFGFRFILVHPDGEPADPGMFVTAIPSWRPGDTFLAGSELQRFRIVDVNTEDPPDESHRRLHRRVGRLTRGGDEPNANGR